LQSPTLLKPGNVPSCVSSSSSSRSISTYSPPSETQDMHGAVQASISNNVDDDEDGPSRATSGSGATNIQVVTNNMSRVGSSDSSDSVSASAYWPAYLLTDWSAERDGRAGDTHKCAASSSATSVDTKKYRIRIIIDAAEDQLANYQLPTLLASLTSYMTVSTTEDNY
jgi:hypothetical protein